MASLCVKVNPSNSSHRSAAVRNVEIVVRHQKEPVVRRMGQFLPAAKANYPDQGNGARSSGLPLTETRDSEF